MLKMSVPKKYLYGCRAITLEIFTAGLVAAVFVDVFVVPTVFVVFVLCGSWSTYENLVLRSIELKFTACQKNSPSSSSIISSNLGSTSTYNTNT